MKLLSLFVGLAIALQSQLSWADSVSYDGTRLLRLSLKTQEAATKLQTLVKDEHLEVLTDHGIRVGLAVDVVVPASKAATFESAFGDYTVVYADLGKAIEDEKSGFAVSEVSANAKSIGGPKPHLDRTWWKNYHLYDEHVTFVHSLQAKFSNISEIITVGDSLEGRPIYGVHLFGAKGKGKPAIIFHGTLHAREWISTMTVEYFLYQLLTKYGRSKDITKLINEHDFYIVPVANPDGFSYSQTDDRLWRKNRRPPPAGSECAGVDLNRNWDIRWEEEGGSSTEPCDQDYRGTSPKSEPEVAAQIALSESLQNTTGISLFIDFHSYGQLFLFPYGYDCTPNPASPYYEAKGRIFEGALSKIRGTDYSVEQACSLYKTTGASDDYHYGTLGVWDSYTIELPADSFLLPANKIEVVVKETWEGIFALLKDGFNSTRSA